MSKPLPSRIHLARYFQEPRIWLPLCAVLLSLVVREDCHDCLFLRTPWGLAFVLTIAAVGLWLGHAGYIFSALLSAVTLCLGAFNVLQEWKYATGEYGPEGWVRVALRVSWGFLPVMLLSAVISYYGAARSWRKVFGGGMR
jgi:hypothetical protein